jgi:hypothetical protein
MNEISLRTLKLFPVTSRPYGLTYEQWSMKWWSWLLNIPKRINPTFDEIGNNAYIGQVNSNVFFLCQTFERTGMTPSRTVSVQRGLALFLPLINWISVYPEDGSSDKELALKAQEKMNTISDLMISINGSKIRSLQQYRFQSRAFHVILPDDNILNLSPGTRRVISDGYWIMTYPILQPIQMKTFGSCTAGLTRIGVNYVIRIAS